MKKGFTLVETLVAISILMMSVVGPLVFVSNGIKASYYARDQITAFYLAQDAIEALRFMRDNDRIAIIQNTTGSPWSTFNTTLSECTGGVQCGIDTVEVFNNLTTGSDAVDAELADDPLLKSTSGYYNYDSGVPTKFYRTFTYTLVNGKELAIVVTINWSSGLTARTFQVRENLSYWY